LIETRSLKREPLCVYLGRDRRMFSPAGNKSEVRRELGWAEDEIVAIYAGMISETKGIIELAEAAEGLLRRYPKFKLVCVGEGPACEHLVRLKEKTGTREAVVITGQIPPEEVPKFLKGSDFMVFPSHSEGMPQAILEAMDCGLAAVASRVGGIPEAVIDGKTGILIEPKNVEQLAAAMEKMICDREFRTRAGREARAFAAEKFDPEKNAKKFADALCSLVG
jgi:glycosyltransferase involved in cell wall biosynthesis